MGLSPRILVARLVLLCLGMALFALGQMSPEEHARHHPAPGSPSGSPPPQEEAGASGQSATMGGGRGGGPSEAGPAGGMGAGMGAGMGGMMEQMGAPKPKELYPSLMELPDLPMEKRDEIQKQAHERMQKGIAIVSEGLDQLSEAAPTDDFAAMEQATIQLREGLAQFESGLAAHRALAEGKAPRNVALQWFKREMSLLPPALSGRRERFLWLAPRSFHYFVIAILATFSVAVVWMYFFKMRRAAVLLDRLSATGPLGAPSAGAAVLESPTRSPAAPATEPTPPAPPPKKPAKWSGELIVKRIFDETSNVKTFRMVHPEGGGLPFTYLPGQYLTLTVMPNGKTVKRSYTIASSPTRRDYVEITVKREDVGVVSRYLHDRVREGDRLEIAAPSGYFTFRGEEHPSVVLIGGGVGITPMMSVIRYLTDRGWPGEIFLVYSCRASQDVIFREEIEYLQRRHANLYVVLALSREENPQGSATRGRITKELIAERVPNIASRRVHICGPQVMMNAVKEMLAQLSVPKEQVKTEAFGPAKGKPRPAASTLAETSSGPGGPAPRAVVATVSFARSGKSGPLPADLTILDVADEVGVEIDNSCRSGTCGSCKVKLLSGSVSMEVEDALEPEDKEQNIILACQAKSAADVAVDA